MSNNSAREINGIKIDPRIFTFKFGCKCRGECCLYGVYADLEEYKRIIYKKHSIITFMDETQTKETGVWFEPPQKDSDFASGVAVGTQVINEKCAFLDKNGLCSLQKLAIAEGEHKWKYKPLYCILFPLTIYENTLTIDDEHMERLNSCNSRSLFSEQTIYEACREELEHFFGPDAFAKLEEYREEYLTQFVSGVLKNE
jgi:hypothetical protein